ncbi:MAG: SDR family NAD(P)-dependent oxidoreductase [Legionellales bacterium]|nr:SDR family NAD(P)-dependent oxidoreductase [Legionellales bacterium]
MTLHHKVAVITGAASGIGFSLAKVCQREGMRLVLADISESALQDKVKQLRELSTTAVVSVVCDVSKREDVLALARLTMAHFNQVDVLFNNAGISGQMGPLWEQSFTHMSHVMEVNLYGVLHGVQAFLPLMFQQSHRSHIVNMASFLGLCSASQMAPYAMSKHAIVAMSESLYFDLSREQKPVDVSVVCPSFANTHLLVNTERREGDQMHAMVRDLMARSRPADDVADHILQEVKKKTFYILPDKEVKDYCRQRADAIIHQTAPHEHSVEKIIKSLSRRIINT